MGLAEINSAVSQLDQVTQQNAAMVEESTAASHTLRQDADELRQLVARFRTAGGAAPLPQVAARASAAPSNPVAVQQERIKSFATEGSAALKPAPQVSPAEDDWFEF